MKKNEPKTNPKRTQFKANTNPNKPNQSQNKPKTNPIKANSNPKQTRSEAQIPTGKLPGILKPGTNFERQEADPLFPCNTPTNRYIVFRVCIVNR
jgi:hypothetical protein